MTWVYKWGKLYNQVYYLDKINDLLLRRMLLAYYIQQWFE